MSIGEVVKRTGLTERTLRFYEELGLIYPGRTEGGRRIYGTTDLTTLHHVTLLKRAGLSLSHIKQLLDAPSFDGEEIVEVQIASLQLERSVIDHALSSLASARKAIALGASLDAVSLCNLIQLGERNMQNDVWKEFYDNHYTPEEQELWKNAKLAAAGGDVEGYIQKWEDLMQRIEQALPLDPASEAAQGYLAEWKSLLVPFANSLDDDMTAEAAAFPGKVTDESMEPPSQGGTSRVHNGRGARIREKVANDRLGLRKSMITRKQPFEWPVSEYFGRTSPRLPSTQTSRT